MLHTLYVIKHPNAPRQLFPTMTDAQRYASENLDGFALVVPVRTLVSPAEITDQL